MLNFRKKLTVLVILLTLITTCNVYAQDGVYIDQDEALEAYNNICQHFEKNQETLYYEFPDEIGGFYLDEDVLVIQLTSNTEEVKQKYMEWSGNYEKIRFESVKYSYNELEEFEVRFIEDNENIQVVSHYVDVRENVVKMGISPVYSVVPLSETGEEIPIVFEIDNGYEETATLQGGSAIAHANGIAMSVCYFGTYNGQNALITCGHENPVGTNIYSDGVLIGSVAFQNLKLFQGINGVMSSYGDFSIVTLNNNASYAYRAPSSSGTVVVQSDCNLIVGLNVCYAGYRSGYATATVSAVNVTQGSDSFKDYEVRGTVRLNNWSKIVENGDSGGIVYYPASSGNKLAGSIMGVNEGQGYMTISPASYFYDKGFKAYGCD